MRVPLITSFCGVLILKGPGPNPLGVNKSPVPIKADTVLIPVRIL